MNLPIGIYVAIIPLILTLKELFKKSGKRNYFVVIAYCLCIAGTVYLTISNEKSDKEKLRLMKYNTFLNEEDLLRKVYNKQYIDELTKGNIAPNIANHFNLGVNYMFQQTYDKAMDEFEKGINHPLIENIELAVGNILIGKCFYFKKNNSLARTYLKKAYKLSKKIKDEREQIFHKKMSLYMLAVVSDKLSKKISYTQKIIKLHEKNKEYNEVAFFSDFMGVIYNLLKDYKHAIEALEKSLANYKKVQNIKGMTISYIHIGEVYFRQGDEVNTEKYFQKAENIIGETEIYENEVLLIESIKSSEKIRIFMERKK